MKTGGYQPRKARDCRQHGAESPSEPPEGSARPKPGLQTSGLLNRKRTRFCCLGATSSGTGSAARGDECRWGEEGRQGEREPQSQGRSHGEQQKADLGTQKIKLVMEWPNLETLSKECDRNQEMETNYEKVMGIRRQQTHNGIPGEKVGKSDNLDSSE